MNKVGGWNQNLNQNKMEHTDIETKQVEVELEPLRKPDKAH